ncbi:MAG: dihydrodipicolinate synthase family protein [Candidatus Falkowbacteria bacterium]
MYKKSVIKPFGNLGINLVTILRPEQLVPCEKSSIKKTVTFRPGYGNIINTGAIKKIIEGQLQLIQGQFYVCGDVVADSPLMTDDEHLKLIKLVLNTVAGRRKVIASTGSNDTSVAIEMTKLALGYHYKPDGFLQTVPYGLNLTQAEMRNHFTLIFKALPHEYRNIPILLYDNIFRTGVSADPDTILHLDRAKIIRGVKLVSRQGDQLAEVLKHCSPDFMVYVCDEEEAYGKLLNGAHGIISTLANIFPLETQRMISYCKGQDIGLGGLALHRHLNPFFKFAGIISPGKTVKAALCMMHDFDYIVRSPTLPLPEEKQGELKSLLRSYNLL